VVNDRLAIKFANIIIKLVEIEGCSKMYSSAGSKATSGVTSTECMSHPDFKGPKPGGKHNHQVCWDQVSHI
jgi:hypothetical protein